MTAKTMTRPRQIDLFSAGCVTCNRTIEMVARVAAADGHELRRLWLLARKPVPASLRR